MNASQSARPLPGWRLVSAKCFAINRLLVTAAGPENESADLMLEITAQIGEKFSIEHSNMYPQGGLSIVSYIVSDPNFSGDPGELIALARALNEEASGPRFLVVVCGDAIWDDTAPEIIALFLRHRARDIHYKETDEDVADSSLRFDVELQSSDVISTIQAEIEQLCPGCKVSFTPA